MTFLIMILEFTKIVKLEMKKKGGSPRCVYDEI